MVISSFQLSVVGTTDYKIHAVTGNYKIDKPETDVIQETGYISWMST